MAIQIGTGVTIGSVTLSDQPLEAVIIAAPSTDGSIIAYRWNKATGFGTRYASPATLPEGRGYEVTLNQRQNCVAVSGGTSSSVNMGIAVYTWDWAGGFGTKFADPSVYTLAGRGFSCAFNPNDDAIAIGFELSPYCVVYQWSNSSGFGTRYTQSTLSNLSTVECVRFNNAGNVLFVGISGYSIYAYRWNSATGFGTKYAGASGASSLQFASSIAVTAADDAVVITSGFSGDSPYMFGWQWNNTTGFGSSYSWSPGISSGTGSVSFNRTNTVISVGKTLVYTWPWNSATGLGTRYTNPSNSVGPANDVKFNNDGDVMFLASGTSPYVEAYAWSDSTGYGTKYADPSVLPTGFCQSIAFFGPK